MTRIRQRVSRSIQVGIIKNIYLSDFPAGDEYTSCPVGDTSINIRTGECGHCVE